MTDKFRLTLIARFPAHLKGNESHVTATILAGPDEDHLSICGTVTMSESEWGTLTGALEDSLGDDVEVEDATAGTSSPT